MNNPYIHPTGQDLIDMFGEESLRPIFQEKILEMLRRNIEKKKQEKIDRFDNNIVFQKRWIKALKIEGKEREEEHWKTYKKNLIIIEQNNKIDKELTKYLCKYVINTDLKILQKKIREESSKLITTLIKQGKYKPPESHITPEQIETAKKIPIRDLAGISTPSRILSPCPFHREKTGSFKIYEEQNRFKCFGCQVFGDSITFVQLKHNLNFIQSVRFLLNI